MPNSVKHLDRLQNGKVMAGPSIENWVDHLGLKEVQDPDSGKPAFRKPYNGSVPLAAELDDRISLNIKDARDRRSLSRSKVAALLGLSDSVYQRYETSVSRLTVSRLIHICEVLGASPEELIAPAAPHLWGDTDQHSQLMRSAISEIRRLDTASLEEVCKLLSLMKKQPEPMAGR